ncbi:MAG: carotenoid oxygenase family protein [Erythrobacter sp.]|nr:carotenoid oxygenase family protein [Erythrobacter sp.]
MSTSPWVQGAYEPVVREIESFDLEVEGNIPPDLNGILARIGPNPIGEVPPDHNLFNGDGMVHSLTLKDGRAQSYRNRWVRTEPAARKLGEETVLEQIEHTDLANTHIVPFAGSLYALSETSIPYKVNEKLETLGREDFSGFIDSGFTAHPHIDPATGEMHAIGYDNNADPSVTHYVIGADGTPRRKHKIALGSANMLHDFAATETFAIIWDLPLLFDEEAAKRGSQVPYKWTPGYEAKVGLRRLDAADASIRWFDAPEAFIFHAVNAWEERAEDGSVTRVHCDVIRRDSMFASDSTGPGDMAIPQLYRWTMDLETGRMSEEMLDPRAQEFGRIDERYWGRKNRFSVTTELFRFTGDTGIIVYDGNGGSQEWSFGKGAATSEAVFVPHSERAGEGEGYILATATDVAKRASKAAIFDAQNVQKGPLAEIKLPQRLPVTFHGSWLPAV